jgi:hypothetical protein
MCSTTRSDLLVLGDVHRGMEQSVFRLAQSMLAGRESGFVKGHYARLYVAAVTLLISL